MRVKNRGVGRIRVQIPYEKMDDGPSLIAIIIMLAIFWPVGAYLGWKKLRAYWNKRKMADFRNYAAIIADRCEVDVREISAKLGKTTSLVFSDLQVMIDKGYMGSNAYLDRSRGVLILDALETQFVDEEEPVEPEQAQEEQKTYRAVSFGEAFGMNAHVGEIHRTEPVRASERRPEAAKQDVVTPEDEYEKCLREIRQLNDEIDDEGVSCRIDRIGELSASIFSVIRRNPEREAEVKKFMGYYLPTTFKLLKSYSLMEKQTYQGENITASRRKIEEILNTLIGAFEKQQDRLFHTDALDVDVDIQVLETMLAKDGLSGATLDIRAMESDRDMQLGAGGN